MSLHPPDDRIGDPPPIGGNGVRIEARATIANEAVDLVLFDLDVDRNVGHATLLAIRRSGAECASIVADATKCGTTHAGAQPDR